MVLTMVGSDFLFVLKKCGRPLMKYTSASLDRMSWKNFVSVLAGTKQTAVRTLPLQPLVVRPLDPLLLGRPRWIHEGHAPGPRIAEAVISPANIEVLFWRDSALGVPTRVEVDLAEAGFDSLDEN